MREFRTSTKAARSQVLPRLVPSGALASAALFTLLSSSPAWAQATIAWNQPTRGNSIAVDAFNNVITADNQMALGSEVTLTKRAIDGSLIWTASYDQTDPTKWENAPFVATDRQGNAIVCATLMSGFSNPVNAASIVMKFSANGTFLWRQVYDSPFDGSYVRKCLVDEFDRIYVVGVGPGPFGFTTKIRKFAPDGSTIWTFNDNSGIGQPLNMKFAPNGDLLVVGRSITGSFNGYARIDRNGQKLWSASAQSLTIGDASSDAQGNTYLVNGNFAGSGTLVKKLGPTGALLWQQVYPGTGLRVQVGFDQQPVICGYPAAGFGAFFFKTDVAGNLLWTNPDADGPLSLLLHAQMEIDASGDTYLAAGTLFEMAVCKVNSDGSSAWTKTTPGSYANAIALGKQEGSVFVVGGQTARILDAGEGQWQNLYQGLPGLSQSQLDGEGRWSQGGNLNLLLSQAPAAAPGLHVFGASAVSLPLFGGTLVPAPDALLAYTTNGVGQAGLSYAVNNPVPSGSSLWVQSWTIDTAAPQAIAASNALRCTAP